MRADIIAFEAEGWISWLVCRITKSKISHIGIMVNNTVMMEAAKTGVKLSKLIDGNRKFHILRYPELTKQQKIEITRFVLDKVDNKYDFKLFIGIGLKNVFGIQNSWNDVNSYICSELIIDAYKSVGIDLVPGKKLIEMTPGSIFTSKQLVEVSDL